MRSVNVPLLIALVVVVAVVGGGVYALHKYQVTRNAVVFLNQAQDARDRLRQESPRLKDEERERRVGEVVRQFKAYLALRPEDADTLEEFGDFLFEYRQLGTAFSTYEQVLWQDPSRDKVRRKLVDIAMDLAMRYQMHVDPSERARQSARWYDAGRQHLEQLLKDSPADAELLELTGRCFEALGKDDEAEDCWRRAIKADPEYVDAYARLAALLRKQPRHVNEADALIEKLAEDHPEMHLAQLAAANYALRNNQVDAAVQRITRALKLKDDDRATLLVAAQCMSAEAAQLAGKRQIEEAREKLNQARSYTEQLRDLFPRDPEVYRSAAEVEARAGQMAKAADVLKEGLAKTNDNAGLAFGAINLLLDSGGRTEAEEIFKRITAKNDIFKEGPRFYLQGRLALADEHWLEAIQLFDKARPGLAVEADLVKQIDYYTGRAYAQLNNPDKAILAYRAALSRDPFFVQAQVGLIDILTATNRFGEAADLYKQIGPRLTAAGLLPMASLLMKRNLRLPPAERDWPRVESLLDEAGKALPNATTVPLMRAEVLLAQGRQADAEKVVIAARDKAPEHPELWATLITLADRQSDWTKVEELLREAESKAGDSVELRLAKGRYLVHRHGKKATEQLQALVSNLDHFSPADQQSLLQGLSNASVQADDLATSIALLRRVADQQQNNVQIRFALFEIALRGRDLETVRRVVDEIGKLEGNGPLWHYGEAALLSQQVQQRDDPRLEQAVAHARAAIEARPSWGRAYLLLAALYDQQGKENLAFDYFRQAIERGELNFVAIQRVSEGYRKRRDLANAQKTIDLLQGTMADDDLRTIREKRNIAVASPGDSLDEAIKLARETADRSKNYRDHLMLGQVLEMANRQAVAVDKPDEAARLREQAEAALRHAETLAPQSPDVWVTLVRFYVITKQLEKAEQAVAQAAAKVAPADAPLTIGMCYEVLGKADEAAKKYQDALAATPKDFNVVRTVAEFSLRTNQLAKAREQAQRVLSGDVPGKTDEQIWARRLLADVFLNEGGAANLQAALKQIDENLKAQPDSDTDLRARAAILAALPSRPETEEAIRALQKLVPLSRQLDDQFLLAQLFARQANWGACSNQMRTLLAAQPNEPRYLVFYIQQLLRHNEPINAVEYLDRLERVAPNQYITVRLRAEYLVARKKYAEAAQLLKGFLDRDGALPSDRLIRLRLVAEALEQFSHEIREPGQRAAAQAYAADAEMIYRNYIAARPEHEILLVGFLVRLGNIDEALSVLERAWPKYKPDIIASQAIEFDRSGAVKQADLVRLEAVMRKGIEKFEKPLSLMMVTAAILQKQNRIAEAEKLYRDVLELDPKNKTALNNLAVLLALERRNLDEALKLVDTAIREHGRDAEILDSRASVYIAMNRASDALRDLDDAINDSPQPIRYFHQAQAYFMTGKRRQAAESLKEALKMGLTAEMLQVPERKALTELRKLIDAEAAM